MKIKFIFRRFISVFIIALLLPGWQAMAQQIVIVNPVSPWTVPPGVTQVKVEVWGAGGGGGGCAAVNPAFGGGGGGGAFSGTLVPVTAGQQYVIVVGAGGLGVSNANGQDGGYSAFAGTGGVVISFGGSGGLNSTNGGGGTLLGATFTGGSGFTGSLGGAGTVAGAGAGSGGGGGGAGNAGAGGNGTNAAAGAAGLGSPNVAPYIGGTGGGIRTSSNNGLTGTAPGAGGGGAYNTSTFQTRTGGNGTAGQVIISYDCPIYSISTLTAQTPLCSVTTSSVVTINTTPEALPPGNYTVTFNRSLPSATGLTASMTVSTGGTGNFTVTGLTSIGLSTITVTNIVNSTFPQCTNSISENNTVDITINQTPSTFTVGGGGSYCNGGTGQTVTLSGSEVGVNYQLFQGANPLSILPGTGGGLTFTNLTTAGNYTVVATNATSGCTANMTGSANISINPLPISITLNNSAPLICVGSTSILTAVGLPASDTLVKDNFSTPITFTPAGTITGGGTIFSQRASPFAVASGAANLITNNPVGNQFMLAATVNTFISTSTNNSTLTSQSLNTAAFLSLSLTFRHNYTRNGNEQATGVSVQVSTDPGNTVWSNINTSGAIIGTPTYTSTQGTNSAFANATFNLSPFINQPNLKIRFNFVSNITILAGNSWWAIDDVVITGQLPLFSWAANTAPGINGLPVNAGSFLLSNKNITVAPTQTTEYTLTEQNPFTNCTVTYNTTVTVNQNSTLALSSAVGTDAQVICTPNAITDITYAVGGGGTGASITAGALPPGLTPSYNAGVFTISGTPTSTGVYNYTVTTTGPCLNVFLTGSITVNNAPSISACPPSVTINTDDGVCYATRTYTATVSGFPAPTVSYIVDGNFIDFPYDFPLGVTTVDVLAEGACAPDATCSFTVTVEDHQAPVPDITNLPDATDECSVTITTAPNATDACDGPITGTTDQTLPITFTSGTHIITWTYTDESGNFVTQDQNVIITDESAPSITCQANLNFCLAVGNTYTIPNLSPSDNCTISAVTFDITGNTIRNGIGNNASGLFNPGPSTVVWTVTDGNNNSSVCTTAVNIDIIPTAPILSGIVNVCPYLGTDEELTYTAFAPGATSYTWSLPANVVLVSGGTPGNNIVVTFNSGFSSQNYKQIRVKASTPCGESPQSIFYLLTQFPNTPDPITGPTNVCTLIGTATAATYKIPRTTAAVSYDWAGPAGTTITHPNGPGIMDTVIDVVYSNSFAGGNITAAAVNGCGTSGSVRTLFIPRTPSSIPGLIAGPVNVCTNISPGPAATYTIVPVIGATSYTWSAPAGSVVTHPNGAGVNDVTITVQYPVGFGNSGAISVSSTNGCGTSALRNLLVTKLKPATPGIIDVIQLRFCDDPNDRAYSYTIANMPANAATLNWTIPSTPGTVLESNTGTSITVRYPNTAVVGFVTVQGINNCGVSTIRSSAVKLPACPPPAFTKEGNVQSESKQVESLRLNVFPNPTTNEFNFKVLTPSNETIRVRILDMQGREFKSLTVVPYQSVTLGADLKSGSYIVEVVQGKNKTTQKLIKF